MPFYTYIDEVEKQYVKEFKTKGAGQRTAERLLLMRELFQLGHGFADPDLPSEKQDYIEPIPERSLNDNLIIASWNIREFDSSAYGVRSDEAMLYIAEIISRFDLVAIQEIGRDLHVLKRLQRILGKRNWQFLVTDETMGTKGNQERMAFFYDARKVWFTGLVGEIVIPDSSFQYARTPFIVGFQAGWFKFTICTVHMFYGEQKAVDKRRLEEIQTITAYLRERMETYREEVAKGSIKRSEYENILLMGDFNIFSTDDITFQAFLDQGYQVSDGLFGKKTNTGKDHRSFDQIAFMSDAQNIQATGRAGVFNFNKVIYTENDHKIYENEMIKCISDSNKRKTKSERLKAYRLRDAKAKRRYYRTYWRTHQISDHYPIWIELKTNFSTEYIERRAFPNGNSR